MLITADEFIKREIVVWGEDFINDLLDRGYEPTLLSDGRWVLKLPAEQPQNAELAFK